jgi:hypothetical protein
MVEPSTNGDSYTFLGVERTSKLILTHHVGRRTSEDTNVFMARLSAATVGQFQLSTDTFGAYPAAVETHSADALTTPRFGRSSTRSSAASGATLRRR